MTAAEEGMDPRPIALPRAPSAAASGPPLAAALAAIQDGVFVVDAARRITWVNAAATRITGYGEGELLGRSLSSLLADDAQAEARRRVTVALAGGNGVDLRIACRRKDGTTFGSAFSLTPVVDTPGAAPQFVVVLRELGDRVRLEERPQQATRYEVLGQLACGVAHDFNNLLTVVTGHVDLLRADGRITAGIADSIDEISRAVARATGLTRRLLTFSRREAVELRVVDLGQVARELVGMLVRSFGGRIGVRFEQRLHPARVLADEVMLEQVLMNLCINARDAMPQGGDLEVGIDAGRAADIRLAADVCGVDAVDALDGEFVHLTVTDSGTGVAPADRRRIFEPFVSSKRAEEGRGIGLSIVAAITRQLGGCCGVDEAPGGGARFSVWLPAASGEVAATTPAGAAGAAPARGHAETVLVVEDDEAVVAVMRQTLEAAGYRVLGALSSAEAMAVWRDHAASVDLVLADLRLPDGMPGDQLAARLRAECPRVPVIFTGGAGAPMRADSEGPGETFLAKPFSRHGLLTAVRAALDRRPG